MHQPPISRRRTDESPAKHVPGSRTRDDDRIEAEAAPKAMDRKDQHQHQQGEIGPRPFPLGIVEAEPEVEDLERADDTPEAEEDAQHQRHRGQHFERVDYFFFFKQKTAYEIVYEIGLLRNGGGFPLYSHPIGK